MLEKSALQGLTKEARKKILNIAEEDILQQHWASAPKKSQDIATMWALRISIMSEIAKAKDAGTIPRSTTIEKIMSLPAEAAEISGMENQEILKLWDKLFKRKKRAKKTQKAEGTEVETKTKASAKRKQTPSKKA